MQGDRIRKVVEGQIVCAIERPPRPLGRFCVEVKCLWREFHHERVPRHSLTHAEAHPGYYVEKQTRGEQE